MVLKLPPRSTMATVLPLNGQVDALACRHGQFVPLMPGTIVSVQSGAVWVESVQVDGSLTLVALLCAGMAYPLQPARGEIYRAWAIGSTLVHRFDWRVAQVNGEVSTALMRQMACTLQHMERLLEIRYLNNRPMEAICGFLTVLSALFDDATAAEVRIPLRMTHEQIATATGCSRPTVTRLLGRLRSASLLRLDRSRHLIVCRSLAALVERAS
jgi:CRP-like cAMP-binding protein